MDCTLSSIYSTSDIYPINVGPHQPGTLRQQLEIADLAAQNPWDYCDHQDAYRAARRTILHHARRAPR